MFVHIDHGLATTRIWLLHSFFDRICSSSETVLAEVFDGFLSVREVMGAETASEYDLGGLKAGRGNEREHSIIRQGRAVGGPQRLSRTSLCMLNLPIRLNQLSRHGSLTCSS